MHFKLGFGAPRATGSGTVPGILKAFAKALIAGQPRGHATAALQQFICSCGSGIQTNCWFLRLPSTAGHLIIQDSLVDQT